MTALRVLAVDWSGRAGPEQRRALWLAEAVDGELMRLEGGRTRDEIVDLLVDEAARDGNVIVGFDFAFSLPAWYLRERQLTAPALWAVLAGETLTPAMQQAGLAGWMNAPEPPFWTTGEAHALLTPEQKFRRTEEEVRALGSQPKSVFQLVGAGQVGRGSLYGMQALHRLAAAGFHVWPFQSARLPLVVEIFPRLLTGPVRKNSASERARYLADMPIAPEFRQLAASSEDAFDAAVSAVVMATAVEELLALADEPNHSLEGKIWHPSETPKGTPRARGPASAGAARAGHATAAGNTVASVADDRPLGLTAATIEQTMAALARARPLFHSEADFQHAFAWQLHSLYPDARIRLETRPRPGVRLDLLALIGGQRIAVELKYLLRDLTTTVEDELFELPFQSAQDVRRYDFVKDIARLEVLLADGLAEMGFAIALTNDPSYWKGGDREGVADAAFRLGEGRALAGALGWAAHTGAGTMRGREATIALVGSYELQWRDFSQVEGGRYGTFRYLLVLVS